jgi:hypothetical protein
MGAEVETVILPGLYRFSVIGINQKNSSDLKDRVYSALRSEKLINLKSDNKKITVNFLPAVTDKKGNMHDLAVALSCLHRMNQIDLDEDILAVGELSIVGNVIQTGTVLKAVHQAIEKNVKIVICGKSDMEVFDDHRNSINDILEQHGIRFICGDTLSEIVFDIKGKKYYAFKNKEVSVRGEGVGLLDIINQDILKVFLAICTKRHVFIENKKDSYIQKYIKNLQYYSQRLDNEEIVFLSNLLDMQDREVFEKQSYYSVAKIDSQTQKSDLQQALDKSIFGFITIENMAEVAEDVWHDIKRHATSSILCFYNSCPCGNSNIFFNSIDNDKCFCLQRSVLRYRQKVDRVENKYFDFYISGIENLELPYTPDDYVNFNKVWAHFRRRGANIAVEPPNSETLEHYRGREKDQLDKLILLAVDIKKLMVILKKRPRLQDEGLILTKEDIDLAITLTRRDL